MKGNPALSTIASASLSSAFRGLTTVAGHDFFFFRVVGFPCWLLLVEGPKWVVVKIMVPFWIPIIMRHLLLRSPKRGHNFDDHPKAKP